MVITPWGIVTLVRPLQLKKAYSPMDVTLSGITSSPVRLLQPEKALSPMVITPCGIVTLVRLRQR